MGYIYKIIHKFCGPLFIIDKIIWKLRQNIILLILIILKYPKISILLTYQLEDFNKASIFINRWLFWKKWLILKIMDNHGYT